MKDYELFKKFIDEHDSIITIEEFKEQNINSYYINKLLNDHYIVREDRGIYKKTNTSCQDPYYTFQYRYKNSIFSYHSALYLLNKTDIKPELFDITVPSDYHVEMDNNRVRVHFTNRNNINLGVITVKTGSGSEVKSYNLERTICDLVKFDYKCGMDSSLRRKIIRDAFDNKEIDIPLLNEYARQLKCEKKMNIIVDILS